MNDDILYHYSTGFHVSDILADGLLKPSAAGGRPGEPPAIWFTSRPTFEPTATKLWQTAESRRPLTVQETAEAFGLARFVVPEAVGPLTWNDWVEGSGVPRHEAEAMERYAEMLGSDVSLYRASFEPVSIYDCVKVEISTDDRSWVDLAQYAD